MKKPPRPKPKLTEVRKFWEEHPLCTAAVNAAPGSPDFFSEYDYLREMNEPPEFARRLHEYDGFRDKRVLEVGCGNAYTLAKYAEHGARVYGVDVTTAAVGISQQRFDILKLDGGFGVGDAQALPFPADFFDCICSMGVLHHVPDTEKAVAEIHRCLKSGGRLILMFYHRNSLRYRVQMPIERLVTGKSMQDLVDRVDGAGNPKGDVYSSRELSVLLDHFSDLEMFTGCLNLSRKIERFIPAPLQRVLARRAGWFLYTKGRKA